MFASNTLNLTQFSSDRLLNFDNKNAIDVLKRRTHRTEVKTPNV